MTEVTILTERELRGMVGLDREAVDAIEDAFVRLADGKVEMPPIMHIDVKENAGDVDIKSAYVRGVDQFAVKIGAGFFNNHKLGLPNSPASVVLSDAPKCVLSSMVRRTGMMIRAVALSTATGPRMPRMIVSPCQ